jgi:molybdenum cofactor cytidylyltransferase
VALTALESGLSPVVLVSGAYAAEVERAVADLPLTIAPNPAWREGQSTSLAQGLQALPYPVGGAVFLLSDQPQIPATLVRSLVELHARTLSPLVAPEIDGRRANPVLFDRQTFPALLAIQGDTGGRPLFSRFPVSWLPWHDPSLLIDVDTEEDYARLQQL